MAGVLTFTLALLAFAVSAAGVRWSISVARRWNILDVPTERSSHSIPTPRIGGVPMVASAILCFAAFVFAAGGVLPAKEVVGTVLFAFGISVLGFLDDLFDLSPLVRIVIQSALCVCCLWVFRPLSSLPSDRGGEWIALSAAGAASVWCIWMVNLYNFMDGIDGLAGAEAAAASSFFFLLFAWEGEPAWAAANLMIAASASGFLVYNRPPARVFLGDSGSAFLGAFYGMQSVLAPVATGIPFIVLVLPFSNFILDTTFTLLRRMAAGEKWYRPHRSHVYQRMTSLGMSHRDVDRVEISAVAVSCLAAAAGMRVGVSMRCVLLAIVFIGLAAAGWYFLRKEEGKCAGSSCPSRSR